MQDVSPSRAPARACADRRPSGRLRAGHDPGLHGADEHPSVQAGVHRELPGQTIVSVELVKTSNGATVGITPTGVGTSDVTVDVNGTLVANFQYRLKLTVDDGSGAAPWAQTFRTLKAPANPNLHVEYITAIPADAVLDMAHRIDKANVVAVPTSGDFIDASTQNLSQAAYTAALKHHQSALVVTDLPVLNTQGLGKALNAYCNAKHGVVLAGQTHWLAGGAGWNQASAIGNSGDSWATNWSLYYYEDITADRVTGGDLAAGSVQSHFLTKGLTDFHVVGPGSGAVELRDYAQGHVLAKLKPGGVPFFQTYGGQFLIAEHQIDGGRTVDLGFRPVVERGVERRVRSGRQPGRLGPRAGPLVGDEPHPADQHALHLGAAQDVDQGDGHRRHGGEGRRQGEPVRHRLPLQGRRRELEEGGRHVVRALPPRQGPPPHDLRPRV